MANEQKDKVKTYEKVFILIEHDFRIVKEERKEYDNEM